MNNDEKQSIADAINNMQGESLPLLALLKIGSVAQMYNKIDDEAGRMALAVILKFVHVIIENEIKNREANNTLGQVIDGVSFDRLANGSVRTIVLCAQCREEGVCQKKCADADDLSSLPSSKHEGEIKH